MFDIAWSELLLIAVVALVVIGPKDLPKAIFTFGKWVRKARVVAREFQTHIDDMMRETELDELRKEALKTRDLNLKKMVEDTIDPTGEVTKAFQLGQPDLDQTGGGQPTPLDTGSAGHSGSPAETAADPEPAAATAASIDAPAPAPVPAASHPTDKQA